MRRTIAEVLVCLKRHADERSDWIGKFLSQLIGFIGLSGGFGDCTQAKILSRLKRQAEHNALARSGRFAHYVAVGIDSRRFGRVNARTD